MSVRRIVRIWVGEPRPDLGEALLERLNEQVSSFLSGFVDLQDDAVVERLLHALLHQQLDVGALAEDQFKGLTPVHAALLLESLAAAPADPDDRFRAAMTLLALSLALEDMVAVAERLSLWPRLDASLIVEAFLARRWCRAPFVTVVVQALIREGNTFPDKESLLDQCLALCDACGQPDVAQEILFRLFTETLGVSFAREWLFNHPAGADLATLQEYLFQRVRQHPSRGKAALFFVDWQDLPQAAAIAATLPFFPEDLDPWQLEHISSLLADHDPALALKLLQCACNHPDHRMRSIDQPGGPWPVDPTWYRTWPSAPLPKLRSPECHG